MERKDKLTEQDEQIDKIIQSVTEVVFQNQLRKDWRGQWFSNAQLNTLRQIYEKKGYKTARIFQVGKIDPRSNRFELKRNEVLLEVLDIIAKSKADVEIGSYIIGRLNPILNDAQKKEVDKK